MINRRILIGSAASSMVSLPLRAYTQPSRKVYRIGVAGSSSATSDLAGAQTRSPFVNSLLRGMHELGYVYGQHFVTEPRGAEGRPERFSSLAAELVSLQLDVIVAAGPMLAALKQATSTIPIPIVMAGVGDPVGSGLVQSLARPGGNLTGLSLQLVETTGKRLELLKELVPAATPVAVLWDRASLLYWQAAEAAARQRGWKLLSFELRDIGEIESVLKAATHASASALLVNSALLDRSAAQFTVLAAKSRLPAMYSLRFYVEAGGLMSYSPDLVEIWRRSAVFVDRILKGANPADIAVEQPTKFELVINQKTARGLGITIPNGLLLRADEVLQ